VITIVNYGMGNLGSVLKAFSYLGVPARITNEPTAVVTAEKLVLPGVGAYGDAAENLQRTGLAAAVKEYIRSGRPFLGICLGMQLLTTVGEEHGVYSGLAVVPGKTRRLADGVKIPHVGWNRVDFRQDIPLFREVPDGAYMYFVHSYCVDPDEPAAVAATTDYGEKFCSVVARDNVYGVQFHPEKSSAAGLRLLRNFAEIE